MGKVNVYLPDELEQAVKDAGIPLSSICQVALRAAVDRIDALRSAADPVGAMGPITPRLGEALERVPPDPTRNDGLAGPLELLGAIALHGENLGARVLRDLGVELPRPAGRRRTGRTAKGFDDDARGVLAAAVRIALELRQERVGTEHVVLALAAAPATADLFAALGVDERTVRSRVDRLAEHGGVTGPAPTELFDRFEAELRRLSEELRQLRGD